MVDFSKHDARSAAEVPQAVKLRDPSTGDYIIDEATGKHCIVLVVGSHSRSVQSGILEDARAKLNDAKSKKKKEAQANALAEVQKTLAEGAARVTRGFENIERDGRALTTSKEDLDWFYDLNFLSVKSIMAGAENTDDDDDKFLGDSFAQQVLKASNDSAAYLGKK